MHRGRLYPLTKYRSLNLDAPYPYWAPARYELEIPAGTGPDGVDFPVLVTTDEGVWNGTQREILWPANFTGQVTGNTYLATAKIGWANGASPCRTIGLTLEQIGLGVICRWGDIQADDTQLRIITNLTPAFHPGGIYIPSGTWVGTAVPY